MKLSVKVLYYVDDDADDHYFFETALKEVDPSIIYRPFYDCAEVLKTLNDENEPVPDIIFLDLNMPGNFNYECLRKIKITARIMLIPVVIYTTAEGSKASADSMTKGAFKHIVKPTSLKELKNHFFEIFGYQ